MSSKNTVSTFLSASGWMVISILCVMSIEDAKYQMADLDLRYSAKMLDLDDLSPAIHKAFLFYLENKQILNV